MREGAHLREVFDRLLQTLEGARGPGESFRVALAGEASDFVRFTRGRIRQAGSVLQAHARIDWISGRRHVLATIPVSFDPARDRHRALRAVERVRAALKESPEDPWLVEPREVCSTDEARGGPRPDPDEAIDTVVQASQGLDFVGYFASGEIHDAFGDSRGQRNWRSVLLVQLDWSLHTAEGLAAKGSFADTRWKAPEVERRVARTVLELRALERRPVELPPGEQRVFLGTAAVREILGLLSWGGFGLREQRTKTTPLLALAEGRARLHPSVTLAEDLSAGIAPRFQEEGFLRPQRLVLVEGGELRASLVSPRSAAEFGVPCNGASASESPVALDLAAGDLPFEEATARLGTGLYVSHLHYLNFSDRSAGRLTGMSRFSTLRVEGGEMVGPVRPMRFDESVYRIFGNGLVALTRERETIVDPDSYGRRATTSAVVPGALVEGLRFVA
jgi:predicted Zn-dependent protease